MHRICIINYIHSRIPFRLDSAQIKPNNKDTDLNRGKQYGINGAIFEVVIMRMNLNNRYNRSKPEILHRLLFSWYRRNGRKFIWRETHDPYIILVSEIMLQQTQAGRVAEKLPVFLRRFPNFKTLARARKSSVIRAWQGMGYNRRAVYLRECAKMICRENEFFSNKFVPIEKLLHLPGVGRYTASAIACFAYNKRVPVVDVNIRRVLSRITRVETSFGTLLAENETWGVAASLLPRNTYYEWNQGLMDVGAMYCLRSKTDCDVCPFNSVCASRAVLSNAKSKKTISLSKKVEPSFQKVPNRLWRGRIIECLRNRTHISLHDIIKKLGLVPGIEEKHHILKLLTNLIAEGLVQKKKELLYALSLK